MINRSGIPQEEIDKCSGHNKFRSPPRSKNEYYIFTSVEEGIAILYGNFSSAMIKENGINMVHLQEEVWMRKQVASIHNSTRSQNLLSSISSNINTSRASFTLPRNIREKLQHRETFFNKKKYIA